MKSERWDLVFLLLSGLWGFVGVTLLAAGSHADLRLGSAGLMLLFHAAVTIGLVQANFMSPTFKLNTLLLLIVGSGIFAADICSRVMRGAPLLPQLAPTGGVLTMLGWLGISLAAGLKLFAKPKA
ncbi:hypothetical protein PQU92_04590 [Asticcacaulis sp. BYS171W]|uniref:DUF423 domain-containing protein n=1 Tax=Asticcacaulis aquaticus TaxID=2984212 RepID=A0ABT5HR49_9CAUL|nr:hypothetical protein [Asticcacaulis aquaticus]MDC7682540.1 hypothetical protein [Asticcacaulis aquaticus]